jgi:hypothetical protein
LRIGVIGVADWLIVGVSAEFFRLMSSIVSIVSRAVTISQNSGPAPCNPIPQPID